MHGRLLRRAALAALLALGMMSLARANAQAPQVGQPPYGLTTHVVIPPDPTLPDQPKKKCGCWATHFNFGCGNFRSNMVFIFGSCRSFYGEPCRKGPAPIYPPGYGPAGGGAPGYGASGEQGCNCP